MLPRLFVDRRRLAGTIEEHQSGRGRVGYAAGRGRAGEPAHPRGQRTGQTGEQRGLGRAERGATAHTEQTHHGPWPVADPQHGP